MKKAIVCILAILLLLPGCGGKREGRLDLSQFSRTAAYAELSNILSSPKDYVGVTVRISGTFSVYTDENTGKQYFMVSIMDATNCCSLDMEFILAGDATYPDDYPKEGRTATVEGELTTYKEGKTTYCTLKNAFFVDD